MVAWWVGTGACPCPCCLRLQPGKPLSSRCSCSSRGCAAPSPPVWLVSYRRVHACLQDLKVSFQNPGVRVFITASLAAAVPAAPVIASMLELLVGNLTALQATSLDLVQQNKAV